MSRKRKANGSDDESFDSPTKRQKICGGLEDEQNIEQHQNNEIKNNSDNASKKINSHESEINCICSMYAIDHIGQKNKDYKSIEFRSSPFDVHYTHKETNFIEPKDLVQFDTITDFNNRPNQVAYFHLGSSESPIKQLHFNTSIFVWPKQYTFVLWINWEQNMGLITTFDSESNAPIYVSRKQIGCASADGIFGNWRTIDEYEMDTDENKWQFVVSMGGGNKSNMYVGNVYDVPKYIGSVQCDIAEEKTWRIGNMEQGPGRVAGVFIFDGWLNDKELEKVYYQSRNEIFVPMSEEEMKVIEKLMLEHISLPVIADIVMSYIRYSDF